MDVGLKIGKYLSDHGITQAFIVNKTGIPAWAVSDICNGKRNNIDCIAYYKICKALGVSMETFIEV